MAVEARIVSNPKVMLGKPVIAGTHITVEVILDALAAGDSIEDILQSHPHLTEDAVKAAIGYAADLVRIDDEDDGGEAVEVSAEEEAILLDRIDAAKRGEVITNDELFNRIRADKED